MAYYEDWLFFVAYLTFVYASYKKNSSAFVHSLISVDSFFAFLNVPLDSFPCWQKVIYSMLIVRLITVSCILMFRCCSLVLLTLRLLMSYIYIYIYIWSTYS